VIKQHYEDAYKLFEMDKLAYEQNMYDAEQANAMDKTNNVDRTQTENTNTNTQAPSVQQ
jgi:hypothetical protein